jgi:hypothetical protein
VELRSTGGNGRARGWGFASAFSSFAALDKHWKRRVEALPKPNGLARIYYQSELDKMVTDIEGAAEGL